MPYSDNQNFSDEILMEQLGNKDSNKWNVFNPGRTIPRGPYLQYKYNERKLKNLSHLQVSGNFNRNMEGKEEYFGALTKQGRRSHINKENENIIQQCNENIHATKAGLFSFNKTRENTGEDKNNLKHAAACIDRIRNKCEPNYIYLKDVIKMKAGGLTESEGWSVLCQSVQALQDLFISSKPSSDNLSSFS